MATKIKSVTILNQQGTQFYIVGKIYNGLLLAKIKDTSIEYSDAITIMYCGYTFSNELIFEAINVPIDVQYEADINKKD